MSESIALIEELVNASGVSGYEAEVREVIKRHLEPLTEISIDNLGSIIAKKAGAISEPRIMIAGHMDEIGLMVSSISKEGFIMFQPLGGWWDQVMLAQRVVVKGGKGDVPGVIGSKPPHLLAPEERKKVVEMREMFIDIGASSNEDVKEMGIKPGDPIVVDSPLTRMKKENMLMGKAMDDRVGCAVFIEVIKRLKDIEHPNTVFGVGTVQEEVGLRGAKTSAAVINPDVAIAAEVSIAGDTPGVRENDAQARLGKGPAIVVLDGSMIPNTKLRDLIVDTAEQHEIPYQFQAGTRGGTDAGRIHLHSTGVPSIVIGVPTRYIHSHVAVIDHNDFENTVKLMVEVIKKLDGEIAKSLKP
ncbi:MAG: peptidase M28 [Candidatus Aquicultor primus]|uniref:Peptidase M28 n=1 Tax=Candidatus Aquicultor primus TaxID=1797195 RepID=A0A1F2URJ2_9ACTN|nr:MAG: peptidase M28 [Candidatus Aquicultor primus]HCG99603.1 peptidase M28 [Actinomycetota bacterium]